MKRLLLVLVAVLAMAPATPPPAAASTAMRSDRNIRAEMHAFPQVLRAGQLGTWVAGRIGDWQAGTLEIHIYNAQLADYSYTSTPAGIECTEMPNGHGLSLTCAAPAGSSTVAVVARLEVGGPLIHSVACVYDQADTWLADDWQFTTGIHRAFLPAIHAKPY